MLLWHRRDMADTCAHLIQLAQSGVLDDACAEDRIERAARRHRRGSAFRGFRDTTERTRATWRYGDSGTHCMLRLALNTSVCCANRFVSEVVRSSGTEGDEEGAGKPKKVSIAAVIALANERAKYKESLQAEREHVSVFACDSCGLWLGCDRAVCPQLAKDNDANLELYSDENLNKRTHLAKHDSVIAIILKVGCVPLVAKSRQRLNDVRGDCAVLAPRQPTRGGYRRL